MNRLNVSAGTWEAFWSLVNRVLVVNAWLALTNLPLLVALAVVEQPWRYPVFFGLLSLGIGPSLAAAFAYLSDVDRSGAVRFGRAYRRLFGPALVRWAATVALIAVLVTDITMVYDAMPGAALVPVLVVLAGLILATGVQALALLPARAELGLTAGLKLAVYTVVRQWPLSLLNLVLLAGAAVAVNQAPLLGLATVPGCVLVMVTANCGVALTRVVPAPDQP